MSDDSKKSSDGPLSDFDKEFTTLTKKYKVHSFVLSYLINLPSGDEYTGSGFDGDMSECMILSISLSEKINRYVMNQVAKSIADS